MVRRCNSVRNGHFGVAYFETNSDVNRLTDLQVQVCSKNICHDFQSMLSGTALRHGSSARPVYRRIRLLLARNKIKILGTASLQGNAVWIKKLRQAVVGVWSSTRVGIIHDFLVRIAAIASTTAIFICRAGTVEQVHKRKT